MTSAALVPNAPPSDGGFAARCSPPHAGRPRAAWRFLAAVALAITLLFSAGPGPAAAARLDVVVWGQKDARWAGHRLGGSFRTMGGSGCALTSAAMVAEYFGSTTDPDQLRKDLLSKGGLDSAGFLDFAAIPRAAGGTISFGGWHATDLALIDGELDSGHPVIAEVTLPGGIGHFVVITGHDAGTYFINDPWYDDTSTINARYGKPASAIHSIVTWDGTPPPASALSLVGPVRYPTGPYLPGDRMPAVFTITNSGGRTRTWSPLVLAVRDPEGGHHDIVVQSNLTLTPGASRSFTAYLPLVTTGTWTAWVSARKTGEWVNPGGKPNLTIATSDPRLPAGSQHGESSVRAGSNQPLQRAQMARLICEAFALRVGEGLPTTFTDLGPNDPSDLYPTDYIAAASLARLMLGRNAKVFDPWSNVTRAQMVTIVIRAVQRLAPLKLQTPPGTFPGALGRLDDTHADNLRLAEYNGLLQGIAGFGPKWSSQAPATGAEAAQLLYRWRLKAAWHPGRLQ